jgi:hypothetical protein
MATPIRIKCKSSTDYPSTDELRALTVSGRHVVLEFPVKLRVEKSLVIRKLASAMPEYSVFDSGGNKDTDWITIMPVIKTESVLAHAQEIRDAIAEYIESCSALLNQQTQNTLSTEWSSYIHGGHRIFENSSTGQIVEAPLGGPPSPQKVDPFFFAEFAKSTPAHAAVAQLLNHDFHDAARMLDIIFGKKT